MTPKTMRSFAGGLLVAAGALGATYYYSGDEQAEALTEEEMREQLIQSGFTVQTEEERQEDISDAVSLAEEEWAEANDDDDNDNEIIYRTIITVTAGMTSIDVGEQLETANIIDDAYDFFAEVEDRGLANDIQPQTVQVDSDMSLDEVVSEFF
ncbi:hypothetical protein [Shouchella shacheensis]|uniref:hypothetical protein n=1 Tax=Shouchella shacheensis TaxID=1649580 RepID=UPI00073FC3BF|nr:hypothetical protein [Shouchella shacheensis]